MTSKQLSPAARLLRSSRLFSVPAPLPRVGSEYAGAPSGSDTATTSYPLHQAIATPASSQARGDWGFKRSLPLRATTRTSTPSYRIQAIDTIEHITDFESSGDLTQSFEKFQELNLPVSAHQPGTAKNQPKSVFEDDTDNTDPSVRNSQKKRWRHQGPWLAGMSETEFDDYVAHQIRGRMQAFLGFIKKEYIQQRLAELQREDLEAGRPMREIFKPTPNEFNQHVQSLRSNYSDTSSRDKLAPLIRRFLDLPYAETGETVHDQAQSLAVQKSPPTTHPSAGLSYLRTDAVMHNHPLLGPQSRAPPVESRIVTAGYDQAARVRRPLVGIGGFVGVVPDNVSSNRRVVNQYTTEEKQGWREHERRDKVGSRIGVTMAGGAKIWLDPLSASVDNQGRTTVEVRDSDVTAVGVTTGRVHEPQARLRSMPSSSRANPRRLMSGIVDDPSSTGRLDYQLDTPLRSRTDRRTAQSSSSESLLESLKSHRKM